MAEIAAAALAGICTGARRGAALHDVSLALHAGEILTLLGAPCSGKTTLMRVLAGFLRPRSGQVLVRGRDATRIAPRRRGVVMVEHGLGLFADMMVAQTLAFARPPTPLAPGLLEAAGLAGAARLRPAALGGGQRAALALLRALSAAPAAVLLDEPASGLDHAETDILFDALLAARAQGAAILYATRDAARAMALGDRMAALAAGAIRQTGRPQTLYDAPADAVVAALTGPINVLPAEVLALEDDAVRVRLDSGAEVDAQAASPALHPGGRCLVCVRPERLAVSTLAPDQLGDGAMAARVASVTPLGAQIRLGLLVGETAITALRPAGGPLPGIAAGRTISVAWQPHHATAYDTIAAPR